MHSVHAAGLARLIQYFQFGFQFGQDAAIKPEESDTALAVITNAGFEPVCGVCPSLCYFLRLP